MSLFWTFSYSQSDCKLKVYGNILDIHHEEGLEKALIVVEENNVIAESDADGNFTIENLCKGSYHFSISHVGCMSQRFFIQINKDTSINFSLEHHSSMLEEVIVSSTSIKNGVSLSQYSIAGEALQNLQGKDIAQIASYIPGVSIISNGNNINKPIINGMSGNRIAIINQGIPLEGQQWGIDHAPEIDAFTASSVSVIKGSAAVKYGITAMSGAIILEANAIKNDPHVHGHFLSMYNTNGREISSNLVLEKKSKFFKYRLIGTFKKGGDRHTPNHYLTNTGNEEKNLAAYFTNDETSNWFRSLYVSNYNTSLGILRGSHIGNLTDLRDALSRNVPFYTKENFSYQIAAPRQSVNHFLVKNHHKIKLNEHSQIAMDIAFQNNRRKEYDVRRGGRDSLASLSLNLNNQWTDLFYTNLKDDRKFQIGIQNKYTNNKNIAGTGIVPLIPNYVQNNAAVYASYIAPISSFIFEIGGRYENQFLNAAWIDTNKNLKKRSDTNHNYAANIGLVISSIKHLNIKANLGYAHRAPLAHERYSRGLHQGIAAIEEGNENLLSESSWKATLDAKLSFFEDNQISIAPFVHSVKDYIYLAPESAPRLTVRGAFPVFTYRQSDVLLRGLDIMINQHVDHKLEIVGKLSYINADDSENEEIKAFLPPLSTSLELVYLFGNLSQQLKDLKWINTWQYTAEQDEIESLDLLYRDNPEAYHLFSTGLSTKTRLFKKELSITIKADNLLDRQYRNYLNRLRYFSDDIGKNISVKLLYNF